MKRALGVGVLALAALSSAPAQAQSAAPPTADEARAETLFNAAKQLRDGGQLAEACPMFAESKRLAPGVGVTLHLGDCYERMGRTASAWTQYREAETLARQKGDDKRADIAHGRAHSVESKVGRLTMTTARGAHDGWQVQLDGSPVPPQMLNAAVAVDPIDHTVTVSAPGKPLRTLKVHLDASTLAATASIEDSSDQGGAAGAAAVTAAPAGPGAEEHASAEASALDSSASTSSGGSHGWSTRTWGEIVLGGVGVVGLGLGAAFLVKKNQSMSNGNACDGPMVNKQAATASEIAFAVGGVALASAVVLYLTTPGSQSQVGMSVSPVAMWGGGGAVIRGDF
jgi:hypothetical protein